MLRHTSRLQRVWPQEQLAEISGRSERTIQRIENGRSASRETMKAVAATYEVDLPQLMEIKDKDMLISLTQQSHPDGALALARVRRIKRFCIQLGLDATIMAGLTLLNLLTTPHSLRVQRPALAWGVALAVSGLSTFDRLPFVTPAWKRRQIETYLDRRL
ncbi:2TM domain-containing protein [Aureimonas sp. D3]|uniref:2TM domain-containing protein n=1 Tax=Aureimonas sp. D3 TaxID=1638164 RepID=UPI0007810B89|nr:2TM domain-containing protein [Aureimonas sp. D3]